MALGQMGTPGQYREAVWMEAWGNACPMCGPCWEATRQVAQARRPALIINGTTHPPPERLKKIDAAENAHAREIENLASPPQGSPALTALRSRIIARFTELETERTEIGERLAALDRATGQNDEPGLLDALPMLGDALPDLPASLQARLFAAFCLELIYNKEDHQVSIYATITPSTPAALAGIIAASEPPAAPPAPDWTFPHNTPERHRCHNHDKRELVAAAGRGCGQHDISWTHG